MKKKRRYIFMTSIFMQVILYAFFLFFIIAAIIMGFVEGWDSQIIISVVCFVLVEAFMMYCGITEGIFFDFEEGIVVISLGLTKKDRVVRVISDIKSIEIKNVGYGADFFFVHRSGLTEQFHYMQRGGVRGLQLKRIKRELSKCIPSNTDDAA